MRRFFSIMVAAAGFSLLLNAGSALALTISPTSYDFTADPGGQVKGTLSIKNDETVARTVRFSIQTFIPQGDTGQQQFLPVTETAGLPSWVYLSVPELTLKPGQQAEVPFSIRIPQDATGGGHYAALFVSALPTDVAGASASTFTARIGALIFLTVNRELTEHASVTSFGVEGATTLTSLPASFASEVKNDGNVHIQPEGTVTVRNVFGNVVAKLPMNPEQSRVLPGMARRLPVAWFKSSVGSGTGFWHDVVMEWKNFALGPYRATLTTSGAWTKETTLESGRVYIWPWHLGLALVGGAIAFAILFRLFRWWVIRRATR